MNHKEIHKHRQLGQNEAFLYQQHATNGFGQHNVMTGMTVLTRQTVDEGLLKCALQNFQHVYPQLTSCIRDGAFVLMECPILPFDKNFEIKDMLHEDFDTMKGPLWRVQLITQENMNSAHIAFGPELKAIVEDPQPLPIRWHHFLRYFQGKVNQAEIENYDEEEVGFRSFILMTFHPSITDTMGAFHLLRQFLIILDQILERDSSCDLQALPSEPLHDSVEWHLAENESSSAFKFSRIIPMAVDVINKYIVHSRHTPLGALIKQEHTNKNHNTQVLRGWLTEKETSELIACMEEHDVSMTAIIQTAGVVAMSRLLKCEGNKTQEEMLRISVEINLRKVGSNKTGGGTNRNGCFSTWYDDDYKLCETNVDRSDIWRIARQLTVQHNMTKASRDPVGMLKRRRTLVSGYGGSSKIPITDMGVAVYGDLGHLFRRNDRSLSVNKFQSVDTWSKPLQQDCRHNIRLEDVFYVVAASPHFFCPFLHSAHILHGRLNYILQFQSNTIDQRFGLLLRDETINTLRQAVEIVCV